MGGAPMSTFTVKKPEEAFLGESDFTAVSFWIISIAMIAATVFFYAEAATVTSHWKTSLHVGGLVTLVAAVHYMYMREYWVSVHRSPIVYRYIDWSITVPLQMIVQPHFEGGESSDWPSRILETLDWHCSDACVWLRWRDPCHGPKTWFHVRFGRLGLHSFRDLRW